MSIGYAPASTVPVILTDEELEAWDEIAEQFRDDPLLLAYIADEDPEFYEGFTDFCRSQMVVDQALGWRQEARPEQLIPGTEGAAIQEEDWLVWLLLGGRGSGKSRVGAEATREICLGRNWTHRPEQAQWALVGTTLAAVRSQMIDSALMSVLPADSIDYYRRSTLEIGLKNGLVIRGYSSEQPDQLRGPNFVGAWADEISSWADAKRGPMDLDTTFSNLVLACRALDDGNWSPRIIATTTPKPVSLIRIKNQKDPSYPGLVNDTENVVVQKMKTKDNLPNLAPHFRRTVMARLEGTRTGRQELEGEILDEAEGALWTGETIANMRKVEDWPERTAGGIVRIVVGVDPSTGDGSGPNNECGIVVVGLAADGRAYVLADYSMRGRPEEWVVRVQNAVSNWRANYVIAEYDGGGYGLVKSNMERVNAALPIRYVHAKKGKALRADPIAIASHPTNDQVRLAGEFPLLEDQMTSWEPFEEKNGGLNPVDSPDRVDAFVYACLELLPIDGKDELVSVRGHGNANR